MKSLTANDLRDLEADEAVIGDGFKLPALPEGRDDDEPSDFALMKVLSDIGATDSDAAVSVYRATPEKGMKGGAFLFSCHPTDFSLETLRDSYGGGTYRVHVRRGPKLIANRLVIIEEAKRPPVAPAQSAHDIAKMLDVMQAGFNQLGQLIAQTSQVPRVDPNQMRRDMMADMLTMKQIFETTQPAQNTGEQAIGMLMKGLELAREITPRDGETGTMDIVMEALKTFGKPIAEAAMLRAGQGVEQLPAPQELQATQPIQPRINDPVSTSSNEENMLKYYAAMLAQKAEQNSDPAIYAGLVVDNMPEDQIRALIDRPDMMTFFGTLNPKLLQYPDWVNEFVAVIREMLTPDDEPASVNEIQAESVPDANNGSVKPADTNNG